MSLFSSSSRRAKSPHLAERRGTVSTGPAPRAPGGGGGLLPPPTTTAIAAAAAAAGMAAGGPLAPAPMVATGALMSPPPGGEAFQFEGDAAFAVDDLLDMPAFGLAETRVGTARRPSHAESARAPRHNGGNLGAVRGWGCARPRRR